MMTADPITTATYTLEIPIAASRERVWEAMTSETNAWWLPDYHMTGPDSKVTLDPVAGGKLVEESDDGSLLWYTVQMCSPGTSLHLVGHVAPRWGGPATTMLEVMLDETADGCVVRVTDALVGSVSEGTRAQLEAGWRELFTSGLKRHVESA